MVGQPGRHEVADPVGPLLVARRPELRGFPGGPALDQRPLPYRQPDLGVVGEQRQGRPHPSGGL